jgi:TRAP-type mannitol/chloroaromatic compound transport system permease small subunit
MSFLLKAADRLAYLPYKLGRLAGWLILPLIFVIMFDVITRKIDFFRIGMSELSFYWLIEPIKLQDMEWHLHGVLLLLSFGLGYLMNSHVRVDIFRELLPRRKQAWIELWGLVIMAVPYTMIVSYFAWVFVSMSYSQGEGSESLTGIPNRYIVKSFTLVGFGILLCACISTFLRIWVYLFGTEDEKEQALGKLEIFPEEIQPEAILANVPGLENELIDEEKLATLAKKEEG